MEWWKYWFASGGCVGVTLYNFYKNNKTEIQGWGLDGLELQIKELVFNHVNKHRVFNEDLINPYKWIKVWENVIALIEHQQYKLQKQLDLLTKPAGIDLSIVNESITVATDSHNQNQDDIYEAMPNINSQSFSKDTVTPIDMYNLASQLDNIMNFEEVYTYVQDNLAWVKNSEKVCLAIYKFDDANSLTFLIPERFSEDLTIYNWNILLPYIEDNTSFNDDGKRAKLLPINKKNKTIGFTNGNGDVFYKPITEPVVFAEIYEYL